MLFSYLDEEREACELAWGVASQVRSGRGWGVSVATALALTIAASHMLMSESESSSKENAWPWEKDLWEAGTWETVAS